MNWFLRCNLHFCSLDFDRIFNYGPRRLLGCLRGGGGVMPCMGYVAIAVGKGMVFISGFLWDRVYK